MNHSESRWRRAVDDALERGWLVFLPFALLPIATSADSLYLAQPKIPVLLAIFAWGWTATRHRSRLDSLALLPRARECERLAAWELCLLTFVLSVCVAYVVVGSRVEGITYADGAYYYGVARHMALTGRFEEPIVWHFLQPPDHIAHAPFDYWGCATSLLLAPSLALFGAIPTTAFVTISVISAASLVAFWYLVCCALPLRYCATQLLAVVIFAFSPALDVYRFQPESISISHLFLLCSLIAFCRRRFIVAIVSAFGMLLSRGDGLIFFALISLAALVEKWRGVGGHRGSVWPLVLTVLACTGTYSLWSVVSFGTLTPPGPQRLPFLQDFWEALHYFAPNERPYSGFHDRFTFDYVAHRFDLAFRTLREGRFAPAMDWWLTLAVAPALTRFSGRPPAEPLIWILCFGGYFLLAWGSGVGFAPVRTPYVFAPLFILAGALGLDVLLTHLHAWIERGKLQRAKALAVGAGVFALCTFFLGRLPVLQQSNILANVSRQLQIAKLDSVLRGEPVASNESWDMIAYTRSPTVSIPFNGEAAIDAVLARYRVQWMVVFPGSPTPGRSRALLDRVVSGERTNIGRFRLERVPIDGVTADVFRVSPAS